MNRLWAPWRIKYITRNNQNSKEKCLFCRVQSENQDKKNLLILRSKHSFAILNKFPYNNGHLLICPYRHIKNLNLLKNEEIIDIFSILNKLQKLLKTVVRPDGFNIGLNIGRAAGAGIPGHMHIHIVPRWKEDVNFMIPLCDTKIISQSLETLYDELHKRIRK